MNRQLVRAIACVTSHTCPECLGLALTHELCERGCCPTCYEKTPEVTVTSRFRFEPEDFLPPRDRDAALEKPYITTPGGGKVWKRPPPRRCSMVWEPTCGDCGSPDCERVTQAERDEAHKEHLLDRRSAPWPFGHRITADVRKKTHPCDEGGAQ